MCHVIEHQRAAFDVDAIVAKVQRHIAERLMIDVGLIAFEHQAIFFPRKIIAPWTFFSAHHEIGVLAAFGPRERHRRVEPDPFPPKRDFARLQNNPKNHITERSREQCANSGRHPEIRFHQRRHNHAASDARDYSADGDPVWNNEMLKIDKRSDDQERNKNPVSDRDLPWETLPDRKEEKRGNQFHCEIAE